MRTTGEVTLNLTSRGSSSITSGENHPALFHDYQDNGSLTVNLRVASGFLFLGGKGIDKPRVTNGVLNLIDTQVAGGGTFDNYYDNKYDTLFEPVPHQFAQDPGAQTHSCTLGHGCGQQHVPCTARQEGATDNNDGTHSAVCSVCGGSLDQPHTPGQAVDNNDSTHRIPCAVCGYAMETLAHDADGFHDNGDGTHSAACSACGAEG